MSTLSAHPFKYMMGTLEVSYLKCYLCCECVLRAGGEFAGRHLHGLLSSADTHQTYTEAAAAESEAMEGP